MSRKSETDIWRESSLAPLPPTTRYGLAFASLKRGYLVEILSNVKGLELKPNPRLMGEAGIQTFARFQTMIDAQFEERKERALEMGLKERIVDGIRPEDLLEILQSGGIPIILTSAAHFDDEDWAHWVVVTWIEKENVYVNDPGSTLSKGRRTFSREKFGEVNGYYGNQVLVAIFQRKEDMSNK